jgi:HNH endonuclease
MSTPASDNCYGDAQLPGSPEELVAKLRGLKNRPIVEATDQLQKEKRHLTKKRDREAVLKKTAGNCHICGGVIDASNWEADHLVPLSKGGASDVGNFLPAHGLCNGAKSNHHGEALQWVLKIGAWAKTQMAGKSELGGSMVALFWEHERKRVSRQKANRNADSTAGAV